MHWLLIDVSGLAGRPGTLMEFSNSGPMEELAGALGRVDASDPVDVNVLLKAGKAGIEVQGSAGGIFRLSCSRCLEEYSQEFECPFDETFFFDGDRAEEEEGYEIVGDIIDLEPMLRDAIVLEIPTHPLHSIDCRGLCSVCGVDRNDVECGHEQMHGDLRWSPLADLLRTDPPRGAS
jgi:uncharacterized protein